MWAGAEKCRCLMPEAVNNLKALSANAIARVLTVREFHRPWKYKIKDMKEVLSELEMKERALIQVQE